MIVGLLYFVLVGVLIAPAEIALRWAWRSSSPLVAIAIGAGASAVNVGVWWWSTAAAVRQLPDRELEVLSLLDARLNT